jgi:hypothetical protein
MMTFSIMTLSIMGLFTTLSITVSSAIVLNVNFAKGRVFIAMLNVVMLSVLAPLYLPFLFGQFHDKLIIHNCPGTVQGTKITGVLPT